MATSRENPRPPTWVSRWPLTVLHPQTATPGGTEELLTDFVSLIASFSGRMYGIRSRQAKARLLAAAHPSPPGTG